MPKQARSLSTASSLHQLLHITNHSSMSTNTEKGACKSSTRDFWNCLLQVSVVQKAVPIPSTVALSFLRCSSTNVERIDHHRPTVDHENLVAKPITQAKAESPFPLPSPRLRLLSSFSQTSSHSLPSSLTRDSCAACTTFTNTTVGTDREVSLASRVQAEQLFPTTALNPSSASA